MRKTLADYAIDAARSAPSVPMCPWVAVESPAISSLGLSRETPLAWTDSTQALLAFRTAGEPPSYVDVGMVEARPPRGRDQCWLGVAISRIKVCDGLTGSGG